MHGLFMNRPPVSSRWSRAEATTQGAMTTVPPEAPFGVARLLLAREATADEKAGAAPAQSVAAAERVLQRLQRQLVMWFGSEGADALLARALDGARASHPILAMVQRDTLVGARLTGMAEAAAAVDPGALADACVALISAVLTLVGRLVGNDLAAHLVEHEWPDVPRDPSSTTSERVGA